MAMKETERSLRWFFLVAGTLSAIQALSTMSALDKLPRNVPMRLLAPFWYGATSHLLLGALFFVAGLRLKQALLTGATWIRHLVVIAGAALIIEVLWTITVLGTRGTASWHGWLAATGLVGIGIRLAVVAYLYASVRRLSIEARARAAGIAFL